MNRRRAISFVVVAALTVPTIVLGAGLTRIVPSDCYQQLGGCQNLCDIAQLASNLLTDGIYIAIFLSAILFAWAGWLNITAMGDTTKISEARKIFWNVLVGLLIILSAWVIVNIIMRALTGQNTWNDLCKNAPAALVHGYDLAVDRSAYSR